eukprot:TRINITY_DN25056_c0_g2_i1.p1 TRINITY_DN25056_c0_g2~~TRINITY_DN25056_c0_g2_i1.p1  ORF type:complete len:402 (+),score=49.05 TRINITY_DN25056_c0_g2_i1:51-1208(+)
MMAQEQASFRRSIALSRRHCELHIQSMRLDVLNTVREEMRDHFRVVLKSLEHMMIGSSVMLYIGTQFAGEGTFPRNEAMLTEDRADDSYDYSHRYILNVYSILASLAIVVPFGCLMLCFLLRIDLKMSQRSVMGDLQRHVRKALEHKRASLTGDKVRPRVGIHGGDAAAFPPVASQSRRASALNMLQGAGGAVGQRLDKVLGMHPSGKLERDSREARRVAVDLLKRSNFYHRYYSVAQFLLWGGTMTNTFCCAIVVGLIFGDIYPSVGIAAKLYVTIVLAGAMWCVCFIVWTKPRKRPDADPESLAEWNACIAAWCSAPPDDGDLADVDEAAAAWKADVKSRGDQLEQTLADVWDVREYPTTVPPAPQQLQTPLGRSRLNKFWGN